jgi:hypothetical protein
MTGFDIVAEHAEHALLVLWMVILLILYVTTLALSVALAAAALAIPTYVVARSAGWQYGLLFLTMFLFAATRVHALINP